MKHLFVLLLFLAMLPMFAHGQTVLNNSGCSCTSYAGAFLPVTNGGAVAYLHLNPNASPAYFETLDANLNVIHQWTDLTVEHSPSVREPWLDVRFNAGNDSDHQTFTPKYYRGWVLFFSGGESTLQ